MFLVWKLWGKPDPSMTANGMLAGLVAITAPCAFVSPLGAVIIGTHRRHRSSSARVIFVERVLKVDDPVGAVSVHGVNGLWGMIALGLFADGTLRRRLQRRRRRRHAACSTAAASASSARSSSRSWSSSRGRSAWATSFFKVQNALSPAASAPPRADELAGLDATEMGVLAYPDFVGSGPLGEGGLERVADRTVATPHPSLSEVRHR